MAKEELKEKAQALTIKNVTQGKEKFYSSGFYNGCLVGLEENEKRIEELEKENAVLERRIERAKECMKKLLFIINSDPANYNCKGLIQDAEDFIHNRTCNIRQQGEHCISETRCIMCDKEIEK